MTKIKQFLTTGVLGPLSIGQARDAAVANLGNADATTVADEHFQIETLKFGSLEVAISSGVIRLIAVYFCDADVQVPPTVAFDDFFKRSTTQADVELWLEKQGVQVSVLDELTFGNQVCLVSTAGVHLLFVDNVLDSLQLASK